MKEKLKEVLSLFFAALFFIGLGILFYWLIFLVIAPFLFGQLGFNEGALSTMMGWSATLFIGYAGYILLDKWKEQENKKIVRSELICSSKKAFVMMEQLMFASHIQKGAFEETQLDKLRFLHFELFSSLNLVKRLTKDVAIAEIGEIAQAQFSEFLTIRGEYERNEISHKNYEDEISRISTNYGVLHNQLTDKIYIK